MKRRELERRLRQGACVLVREGARHSIYMNPANGKTSAVPRHAEIKERLAVKIFEDLGLQQP